MLQVVDTQAKKKQQFPSTGCWSPIGYRAGRVNQISLGSGCHWKDVVMHEMAHTLGFFHEQARPDRDRYVRILWNNVIPEQKYNFEKQSVNNVETLRYISISISKGGRKRRQHVGPVCAEF